MVIKSEGSAAGCVTSLKLTLELGLIAKGLIGILPKRSDEVCVYIKAYVSHSIEGNIFEPLAFVNELVENFGVSGLVPINFEPCRSKWMLGVGEQYISDEDTLMVLRVSIKKVTFVTDCAATVALGFTGFGLPAPPIGYV